ncbi:MAG: T9SS type A sorting domain-containing protein, partial [Ignavibacteria bacterium]|nr:T9SS type A sorting domain-containing protein [Ignavibacteria bacterium]
KSTNGGISFNRINSGIGYPFILSLGCNLNNDLFAGSFGEGVYRSTDGGVSWQTFNSGLENLGIHSIQVKKTGVIFLGTEGGIYRSTNNGYSWHKRGFNNSKIECLAIDSSDNLLLGVYDYSNPFEPKAYLYRSSNEGLNWETIKEFFRINSIHIGTYGNYYVSAGNSFYYSYDQGVNWGQSAIPHSIYAITSNKNNLLYVGTINGVYVSTDLGVSWGELHSGLPSTVINVPCLEIDSKGYIYIGITDQTMYKSKSSTTDIDDQHYVINNFKLSQNYPNPFNPSTKISWQSPIGSWQTLKVYDVLGNEVATLVNEYRPAGNYEVEFSAKGGSAIGGNVAQESLPAIASGVYFYRLQAGSYVQTKKMIYLK